MPEQAYKCCKTCGETKPLSEFTRNRPSRDGYLRHCKVCTAARAKESKRRHRQANRERIYEAVRLDRQLHPDRWQARRAVERAIKSGKLVRPAECERCGEEAWITAHHADYSKWLEVEWLCGRCHAKADAERLAA